MPRIEEMLDERTLIKLRNKQKHLNKTRKSK